MTTLWTEIGDRVFVRRYRFFDQNIVAILSDDETLLVDTRTTHVQAREVLDDLRELQAPVVGVVVNTHGHYDHTFGNSVFRPAPIWGHERCVTMLRESGERMREGAMAEVAPLAADLAAVVIDPPNRTFTERAVLCLGDREIELAHLGRGHTDNDIVVRVPDADVVLAGDLVENGAVPYFGDGYPLDWPATAEALLALVGERTVVVPGHGDHAGRTFVEQSLEGFRAVAVAARRVHAGDATVEEAAAVGPWPAERVLAPIERGIAQLRGELGT